MTNAFTQALVERGMLDSVASGVAHARDHLELYIGPGNSTYLLIAIAIVLLFLLLKPRR